MQKTFPETNSKFAPENRTEMPQKERIYVCQPIVFFMCENVSFRKGTTLLGGILS